MIRAKRIECVDLNVRDQEEDLGKMIDGKMISQDSIWV